jgi:hypothetical protein
MLFLTLSDRIFKNLKSEQPTVRAQKNYGIISVTNMIRNDTASVPGFRSKWIQELQNKGNVQNPSSHTMSLGFTQPLTKMSTRNLPGW